jgi:hypothetical protein
MVLSPDALIWIVVLTSSLEGPRSKVSPGPPYLISRATAAAYVAGASYCGHPFDLGCDSARPVITKSNTASVATTHPELVIEEDMTAA